MHFVSVVRPLSTVYDAHTGLRHTNEVIKWAWMHFSWFMATITQNHTHEDVNIMFATGKKVHNYLHANRSFVGTTKNAEYFSSGSLAGLHNNR